MGNERYINIEKSNLLDALRKALANMSSEERIDFINDAMEEYCRLCGVDVTQRKCFCSPIYDE